MRKHTQHALLLVASAALALMVTACGDDDKKPTPPEPGEFTFRSDPPSQYIRVDRMGMPAVATALISPANKSNYNDDDPEDDVTQKWVTDIVANLSTIHTALDDDLTGLSLTPASVTTAAAQGGPLIIPDALTLNLGSSAGFPNGRQLADQVIDITLAVILLDLGASGQTARTFADLPVNPPANDKSFSPIFPYLASKH